MCSLRVRVAAAVCSVVLLHSPARAVLLVEESFDYTAGQSALGTGSAVNNWAGSWYVNNPDEAGRADHFEISSDSLTYVDSGGRQLVASGNHFENLTNGRLNGTGQGGRGNVSRRIDTTALAQSADSSIQAVMFDEQPGSPGTEYSIGKAGSTVWISFLARYASSLNENVAFGGLTLHQTRGEESTSGNASPIELIPTGGPVDGDYNADGSVNLADYTVWRDSLGSSATLPNDPTGGVIGIDQYNTWKANFNMVGEGDPIEVRVADAPETPLGLFAGVRGYSTRAALGSLASVGDGERVFSMNAHRSSQSTEIPGFADLTEVDSTSTPANSDANLILVRIDFEGDPTTKDANGNWIDYPWFDPETGIIDRNGGEGDALEGDHPQADRVYMWVNPELDVEPSLQDAIDNENAAALMPYLGEGTRQDIYYLDRWDLKFDTLNVGAQADPGSVFDEIRLGTEFADVTPFTTPAFAASANVPEPKSVLLLAMCGMLIISPAFRKRWA